MANTILEAMETYLCGKMVAITANDTVGFGTAGDAVKGRIFQVDYAGDTDVYPLDYEGNKNASTYLLNATTATAAGGESGETYVVSVEYGMTFDNVAMTSTTADQPSIGDIVAVDGAGGVEAGVVTDEDTVFHHAYAERVDTTAETATVRVL